jgi:predicted small secreted protein
MSAHTISRTLRLTGMTLALIAGLLAASACNTWHGAGKDVEKTGAAMQRH